jgi:hypothetical protein
MNLTPEQETIMYAAVNLNRADDEWNTPQATIDKYEKDFVNALADYVEFKIKELASLQRNQCENCD